jgi:uncharacterized protein (TIGR00255 family)
MTAFARQAGDGEWGKAVWEIRTVNHRYLETSLRLPEDLRALETDIRERIAQKLHRGKVDCTLRYSPSGQLQSDFSLNRSLVTRLVNTAREIEPGCTINPLDLMRWPGVLDITALDADALRPTLLALLDRTLEQLLAARAREGAKLRDAILARRSSALAQVELLRVRAPEIVAGLRARYTQRVMELGPDLDQGRLEQECALLAQKLDVDEELDRLAAHLAEVERVLQEAGPIGRRLDFLTQEMHREANTVGAKSAHIETTNASLELRVLIEQMREQVQNIE